ncbi:FAD-binding oxidoreductase [Agromyces aerolatus]|uniref:FAD-binding oxidoreductase n=1 Tax=Agromyces sp. LY-1074 TaxID=3074080 RepID=UPI00285493EB|nr:MULTISPECIES: FAD-binding oxidoreductase [unclassified Agromyces]MDR5698601.1 FAD-binding oxidoreductase [Agromyces sp. LY-1074]MDR5704895.1 FAD-binding oxidoreductase [Agromyces sp. LY-1358]
MHTRATQPADGTAADPAALDPRGPSRRDSFARLGAQLDGRLVTPGADDWDLARVAWNLAVDQRPAAVVVAASTDDVVRTVNTAREAGLAVAPQATGHNAGPLAADDGLADAILLRTHELRGVEVDVDARVARVEAGAQWGDVIAAVAPHGLTALAGSSHDVGVVGYTLGGGLSWLARSHGIAANHVIAAEVVTADGRTRRVDAEHDEDLFWAIRGGGGDFAIVTALEFRLYPIATIVAGALFFPLERTEEVLQAWRTWTETVPDAVTSLGRVLRIPPMPELPPFLAGKSFVAIEVAIQETPDRADELLAPLRELGPDLDSVHPQPTAELLQLHMDPPEPVPGFGDGMALAELGPDTVRAFADATGPDSDCALLSVEIRHLGGMVRPSVATRHAASRGLPFPGATAGFDAGYAVYAVGIAAPGLGEVLAASLDRVRAAIAPWQADLGYLNFAEYPVAPESLFGDRLRRLRAVKDDVDPAGVLRSNHPVR